MAETNPIAVGIVGLGRIGWSFHALTLAKRSDFKVVACVDPLPERRAEAEQTLQCKTFTDLKGLLKSGLAEVAVVCTRSNDHAKHTIAALKAGLHVLVEKPMAMNVREADRMIAAAKDAGRVLTVNQSNRYSGGVRFIRETIQSGILGEVFWMRYAGHTFFRRNDWQMLKKFGGGYLNNNGAHSVDFCIQLLDSPVKDVWGELKHTVTAGDADDFMKVILRGENGRVIECEQSYCCAFPQPTWLVCGTYGTMQITGKEAKLKYFDPKEAPPLEVKEGAAEGRKYGNDDKLPWKEEVREPKPSGPEVDLHENLAAAIRAGAPLVITPESVREQIRVLDLTRKSCGWKA